MIQESIHECCLILAPFNTVLRLIQTPSSITTPGPIVTFGPWKDIIKNISAFKSLITYHAVGSNFGSWVDNDVSNKTWPFRQQRAVLLTQRCEVETHSCKKVFINHNIRIHRLLAEIILTCEEVSRLTNVHPESLKLHTVQLAFLCLSWEDLFLNTRWLDLDPEMFKLKAEIRLCWLNTYLG